ncbi:hypothetical protein ABPG72_013424 [Tetrahymena utriculariae]
MDQSANGTYLLQEITLEQLDFNSLSDQALQNLKKELLQLGADCELQRVFIQKFGLNKISFYQSDCNNDFQQFKFIIDLSKVAKIDQYNQTPKNQYLEDYDINDDILNNKFTMVMFDQTTCKIQQCINSAIEQIFYSLEHKNKQFINSCYEELKSETKQNYILKYYFHNPLVYCQDNTTHYFSEQPESYQQYDQKSDHLPSGEQVDYSEQYDIQVGSI